MGMSGRGILRGVGVLAALGLAAVPIPARAQEARADDFWTAAADAATATLYAPTAKGLRLSGLAPLQSPPQGVAPLTMVCAGEWNVAATYDTRRGDGSATISQATRACTGDFGASQATGSWTFTASGHTFTIDYLDCRGHAGEQSIPAVAQCAIDDAIYAVDGLLPAAHGKQRTFVHIDTLGLSREQIRTFVRSLTLVH